MKTAYKFRMYPNRQQEAMLDLTLETCRHLYNEALADRKNAYEVECISRTDDFMHKVSRKLIDSADLIVFEIVKQEAPPFRAGRKSHNS